MFGGCGLTIDLSSPYSVSEENFFEEEEDTINDMDISVADRSSEWRWLAGRYGRVWLCCNPPGAG